MVICLFNGSEPGAVIKLLHSFASSYAPPWKVSLVIATHRKEGVDESVLNSFQIHLKRTSYFAHPVLRLFVTFSAVVGNGPDWSFGQSTSGVCIHSQATPVNSPLPGAGSFTARCIAVAEQLFSPVHCIPWRLAAAYVDIGTYARHSARNSILI